MEAGTRTGRCDLSPSARRLEFSAMGCCGSGPEFAELLPDPRATGEEMLLASRIVGDGVRQTDLSVPAIHCGACIRTIENVLSELAGVDNARVNLSTRR